MNKTSEERAKESEDRKAAFRRLAVIDRARKREQQTLYSIQEGAGKKEKKKTNKENKPEGAWSLGQNYSDQFEYVKIYKEKFEAEAQGEIDKDTEQISNENVDTISAVSSRHHAEESVSFYESTKAQETTSREVAGRHCELPNIRVRGRGGRIFVSMGNARSVTNSICRFEEISTVVPPTVIDSHPKGTFFDNEYSSSISVGQLQSTYFRNYKINTSLPIINTRDFIINSINSYNVTIIEGATGCGKTTQVPLYILEDAVLNNKRPDRPAPVIYVTQPRRIAARSIARRVCEERGWELGTIVGYQVGLDKKVSSETILCFCTAGSLLQKLITEKTLTNFSHIIIDEAHERDADTDLLMMFIRSLMRKEKSFFRLLVMSATMDMDKLRDYFTCSLPFGHIGQSLPALCQIQKPIDSSGRKTNEINIVYFDKLRSTFNLLEVIPDLLYDEPTIPGISYKVAVKLILNVIPHLDTFCEATKSTLVFLPGLAEITKLHKCLVEFGLPDSVIVIPLHSCLSTNDQNKVFEPSKRGHRKVILATNIAESSITVKDVGFIIDFCLTKNLVKDPVTRFPVLRLEWESQDRATQRAGRTGRCCEGKVFRLVTSEFFDSLPRYALPELLVAPLELSVLRVKNFQMGELKALFALVMDPPALQEIKTAVLELKQIGALSSTFEGKLSDIDGDLTELGRIISILPIDVHLSKLIVIANLLDVMDDAIIIASSLSTNRTVVRHIYGDLYETYINKYNWSRGSNSDLFINLDIYKEYRLYKDEQQKSQEWLDNWCRSRLLDERKLNEVSALVEEITVRLEQINIESIIKPNMKNMNREESELMLKMSIAAAFYPNYFLNRDFDVKEVKKSLCTLDPRKTVIVGNLPLNQSPLYCDQILNQITGKINSNIDYITDNSRALLLIKSDKHPLNHNESEKYIGENAYEQTKPVDLSVYLAIKFAECDRLLIREYQTKAAIERMAYYKEHKNRVNLGSKIPPPWMKMIRREPGSNLTPDNSRLINATDEEYGQIEENFYIEIQFDDRQNARDLVALDKLEKQEDERRRRIEDVRISRGALKPDELKELLKELPEHPVFKKEYRKLRGPYSPVEITFEAILEKSKAYTVEIDHQSINSILLDPIYEEKKSQMLVAATVGHNRGNKIVARDTTLMPRVKGLPTIMALMFAQYYRVKYNNRTKCISGAIFGLGWDEKDEPISREYEVELDFDIHLTNIDIELINNCRSFISELLRNIDSVQNPGAPKGSLQEKLKESILMLLRRRRYPIPSKTSEDFYIEEELFLKDRHNVPKQQLEKLEDGATRVFLPLMETSLDFKEMDLYNAIRENLNDLRDIRDCKRKPPLEGIRCLLCGHGRSHYYQMFNKIQQHLDSDEHLENLITFEDFEACAKDKEA